MSTHVSVHCCDDKMCPVSTLCVHCTGNCTAWSATFHPSFYYWLVTGQHIVLLLLLLLVSISFYYYWSLVTIFLSFFFTQLPLLFIFMSVGPSTRWALLPVSPSTRGSYCKWALLQVGPTATESYYQWVPFIALTPMLTNKGL